MVKYLRVRDSIGFSCASDSDSAAAGTDACPSVKPAQATRSSLLSEGQPAGDEAFSHDGRTVLMLDEAASAALVDTTPDFRKTGGRSRLKLHRRAHHEVK